MVFGAGMILFFPWSHEVSAPAILRFANESSLYVTEPAQITKILVSRGSFVKKGEPIFTLVSPALNHEQDSLRSQLALLDWRISYLRVSRDSAQEVPVATREREALVVRLRELNDRVDALTIRSPFDGVVVEVNPDLRVGEWVGAKEGVARVLEVTPEKEVDKSLTLNEIAWGYVNEKSLYRLQTGAKAVFIPDDLSRKSVELTLTEIDTMATQHMGSALELASQFGSEVATVMASDRVAKAVGIDAGHAYTTKEAQYRLRLAATEPMVLKETADGRYDTAGLGVVRGHVVIDAESSSLAGDLLRHAWAVILRESGF